MRRHGCGLLILVYMKGCFARMFRIVLSAVLLSAGSVFAIISADAQEKEIPKREFRGAWLHIVGNKTIATLSADQVKQMFLNALDSLQEAGCNAVIFQVRPTADAFYYSEIEPWSRYLTGEQGKAPEPFWDPLEFMVQESHKRGMELHAWCNPYRVTLEESDQLCKDHLYFSHPELFVKHGKQLYLNPAEPLARSYTVRVIADIVRRYDIQAIHFDDYFYPYPISGVEFDDQDAFSRYAAAQGFSEDQKADWRRHNVELLIQEINDTIKTIKPWVRFGISPFGIHRNKKDTPDGSGSLTDGLSNYDQLYADVPGWAEKGYIDYCVPQLYWKIGNPKADYDILIHWWDKTVQNVHLYIGQNISTFKEKDLQDPRKDQTERKIELTRTLPNVRGNVWWPGWSFCRNVCNIFDNLKNNYQRYPALIPAYSFLDDKAPSPVADIHKNGRLIEWGQRKSEARDPMQKALFYAVYCFPDGVPVNIDDSRYLLKITQDTSYNVVAENKEHGAGCKYVVTVIDRCWNESRASRIIWY